MKNRFQKSMASQSHPGSKRGADSEATQVVRNGLTGIGARRRIKIKRKEEGLR